jgi:dCTP deaminase
MAKHHGALPDSMIRSLISSDCISGIEDRHVGPASVDLPLSEEIYRIAHVFLPRPGEKVRDILRFAEASRHDFKMPLERGSIYIARIETGFHLPENVYGYCNPKSSTGRADVHARVVADGVSRYDALTPHGFSGEAWVFIKPQLIPIRLFPGEALSQARFFDSDTRLEYTELGLAYREHGFLTSLPGSPIPWKDILIQDYDGSLILTLDLESEIVGWECFGSNKILDFSKRNHRKEDFFRPILRESLLNGALRLRSSGFFILSSAEAVRVPPSFACEMVSMDDRSGEFRSHYAGFIDPGWGCGEDGCGAGDPLTLEVRPFEDIVIRPGQPIAKIRYERMARNPDRHYGELLGRSNYLGQRNAKLSKHFSE